MSTEHLFVACHEGLEAVLAKELTELGLTATVSEGGVEASGPSGSHRRVNVWSRIADRVHLQLGQARRPHELTKISLRPYCPADARVTVHFSDEAGPAWRDGAKQAWGPLTPKGGALEVFLRVEGDTATVFIDTSGELLHVRGFRQETGVAPLRETLAAGVLALGGFTPSTPLWDVMCGSGTLLIEAAEQQAGLAPGRARWFAFQAFPSFDEKTFAAERAPRAAVVAPKIIGTDLNAGALGVARRNSKRAGVFERLELNRLDATKLPEAPREGPPGLVIANLPYGKRVGDVAQLRPLYAGVGKSLRRHLPGWRFAFLLRDDEEALGLDISQRTEVINGGLRCVCVVGDVSKP